MDDELMAGVSEHPAQKGLYVAFVLRYSSGEYLGYQPYTDLNQALASINAIRRSWTYEKAGGCGNGACGGGTCSNGGCRSQDHTIQH